MGAAHRSLRRKPAPSSGGGNFRREPAAGDPLGRTTRAPPGPGRPVEAAADCRAAGTDGRATRRATPVAPAPPAQGGEPARRAHAGGHLAPGLQHHHRRRGKIDRIGFRYAQGYGNPHPPQRRLRGFQGGMIYTAGNCRKREPKNPPVHGRTFYEKSPACGLAHAGFYFSLEEIRLFWIKQIIGIGIHPSRSICASRNRNQQIGWFCQACISIQSIGRRASVVTRCRSQALHHTMAIAKNANSFLAGPDATFASRGIDCAARRRCIKYKRIIRI